jgi:hypothetical protein
VKEVKVDPAEPRPTEAGGRGGLEPRTSALIGLERSATEGGTLHETAGVIWFGTGRLTRVYEDPSTDSGFGFREAWLDERLEDLSKK